MSTPTQPSRLVAIDWMRGFVMVLMAVDHASLFYNEGRVSDDSSATYVVGSSIDTAQFFTRWITHLCAPTFLFLSGTALALSAKRRKARGQTDRQIDRDLLIRGIIIAGLDLSLMSLMAGRPLFQVLYAIGVSMIFMVPLRRLPNGWLMVLGIGWFVVGEAITGLVWTGHTNSSIFAALTVARYFSEDAMIFYPFVPWLAMMVLGWVFGNILVQQKDANKDPPIQRLLIAGLFGLLGFVVVRVLGGYGNMFLQADDAGIVQWLHVSKYPPSLSFASLELGLMCVFLAFFFWLQERVRVRKFGPLLVFGQTALFFYLSHFMLLGGVGRGLGLEKGGLGRAYFIALVVLILLYVPCVGYREYKQSHPKSWVRFI